MPPPPSPPPQFAEHKPTSHFQFSVAMWRRLVPHQNMQCSITSRQPAAISDRHRHYSETMKTLGEFAPRGFWLSAMASLTWEKGNRFPAVNTDTG